MQPHPSLKMKPERRAKLFKAATAEFTALGFEQASLNRIISEVGMSKSSFYHYFANKTELFQQIIAQTLAPIAQIVDAFQPETLTKEAFWSAIISASQEGGELLAKQPEIFDVGRMFYRNLNEPSGICTDMMKAPLALMGRILERGKVVGTIRDDLPTSLLIEVAMGMGMTLDKWAIEHMEDYSRPELEVFTEKAVGMFVKVLSPEG